MGKRQNTLANDDDYALGLSTLVYSKKTKAKLRRVIKKKTLKRERQQGKTNPEGLGATSKVDGR
jgi:hypothetical protein